MTAGLVRSAVPGAQTGSGLWITRVGTGPGWGLITTSEETAEVQPALLVTVKLYVPGFRPFTVTEVPVELIVMLPGKRVSIHSPVAGRPFNTALPVGRSHVGWVIVPGTGAVGVGGWALIVTAWDCGEVHPSVLVTENV